MFTKSTLIAAATITLSAVMFSSFSSAASLAAAGGRKIDRSYNNERSDNEKPVYWYRKHIKKSDIEISCKEGKQIVARQGFEAVRILRCEGRNFKYLAFLDGSLLRVDVNRRGDIVGAWNF